MGRHAIINKEIPLEEIRKEKARVKTEWSYFEKLTFIEDLYADEEVKYAVEKRGKTAQCGYNWLAAWNEFGFEGLKRKPGSKGKSKLTDDEFKKLKDLIIENDLTSNRQVKKLIEDEFNVTYSERHISRIMSKLGFGYAKPYVIPAKSPEDAAEQLKKTLKKQMFH